ncbi:MAG: PAS domain-containing protein, partial [Phycisphaerae bacterium]
MYASFLLALSVLLQLIAAALALRLIRITGWRGTWLFIAAAILLQAVRRCVMLVAIWTGYILGPPDLVSEWVGLVVSALMVAGVGWIAPLFLSVRRLHEEALRSAELEKATVFDTMSDLVVYHDMDMRIVRANKAAAESVGSTPDGLRGRFCYEIRHGRSEVCEGCPVVKARQTGQPQEAQMRGPGGRTWFVRADPLRDATGKLVGILEVTQNITERSRMEAERARLATAIEQAAEAIVITDTEGAIQYVNPAFERITGYTLEEAIGQNPRVLKSGKQDEGFYKQLWDTI